MNPGVYLLVNSYGTKTKQWVLVNAGNVFPRVFTHREVAKAYARLLTDHDPNTQSFSLEMVSKVQKALIKEIRDSMPTSPSELGCTEVKPDGSGHEWCLACPHLRLDGTVEKRTMRSGRLYRDNSYRWMCGKILQEVMVARHLADR